MAIGARSWGEISEHRKNRARRNNPTGENRGF
jgi:hypothetical protein